MEMDIGGQRFSFFAFHAVYRTAMYVIFACSLFGAVIGAILHLWACFMLTACAVLAIMFNLLLTLFYEESLHVPASYTIARRNIILLLGWSTQIMFAGGWMIWVLQVYEKHAR